VRIENANGQKFDLPESEFSKPDIEYLKKVLKRTWNEDESWMRSSRRHAAESNYKQSDYGFRVAFKKID